MKTGYIEKDRQERFANKRTGGTRAWYVNAWRIVDASGNDMVQPWCSTCKDARATAAQLGITIMGSK